MPWFDPAEAGVTARILILLEAPGRCATGPGGPRPASAGSEIISPGNDDQTAANGAITEVMIRDLMAETLAYRFGAEARRVPHPIEWLSDNGPAYTANETRKFGRSIGLLIRTTPAYSPESNGMAEVFVKTFKRDYVYLAQLDSAESVMQQLPTWSENYNEVHPHKALRMKSPREYLRAQPTG